MSNSIKGLGLSVSTIELINVQHFIITRFCCKVFKNDRAKKPTLDPLSPVNLATRFRLLEMISLPSIRGQSNQDFTWIILFDPDLSNEDLNRLKKIALQRPNTILHQCVPSIDFLSLNWLEPYVSEGKEYILTSNFDDDDTAPIDFVNHLHKNILEQQVNKKLPVMKTYGFRKIINWDLAPSYLCPFGTLSPWHRKAKVSSCGFSFLCKYPEYDINVTGGDHTAAMEVLDFSGYKLSGKRGLLQQKIEQQLKKNNEDLSQWEEAQFFDLSKHLGPVIMSNHSCNIQETRLTETKLAYKRVFSENAFGDCLIDWGKVEDNIHYFKK